MKRFASIVLLFLSVAAQSIGQSFSYGLDASRDSLALEKIRERMDSVRRHRPTVGLALCGGGAKGAAEIGVIRYLEEQRIPVDLVTGTSIGGLVGGFYAIGYNAAQMDSIMRNIDWNVALTDRVPRNYLSYNNYQYSQKFLVSVPFYYPKEVYLRDHMEEISHDGPHGKLHLGADAGRDTTKAAVVRDNIKSSLPSGMASGQNVRNIFSSYTVGYQDDRGFWDFPRPFACVATEMVSAKPKVWFSGKLNTALRSTMSIPGLFTPVKLDGMVLVDGGMRNNYPVDLAREMGADFVIGVDLSEGYLDYSEINNIGDILVQGINMLGRESYEKNAGDPDVSIKPDLKEYTMLSFDVASIDTMLRRGYEAAAVAKDSIVALRKVVNPDSSAIPAFFNAADLSRRKVLVSTVEFSGIDAKEEGYLTRRLDIEPWTYVGKSEIEAAVATIYGTKAFDSVTYELLGTAEPYVLHFDCHKGPIHQFGVGLRADTDEMVSLLFNVGLNVHCIQGNALDFTGKLGANPYARLHYCYMLSQGPTINFATSVRYVDNNTLGIIGGNQEAEVKYINARNEVWFSNLRLRHHDIGFGIRGDYYGVKEALLSSSISTDVDAYGYETADDMYFSLFYQSRTESFDDAYFPDRGVRFGLDAAWIFGAKDKSIDDFCTVQADFKTVIPFGRHLALLPFASGRAIVGGGMIPVTYANMLGGRVAGRYLDQQIPFMGVTYAVGLPRTVVTGGAELRLRVAANNYFTAVAGFGDCAPGLDDLLSDASRTFSGFGLEYAYDSILGPFRADVHWSSLTHRVGVYLSLGFDF